MDTIGLSGGQFHITDSADTLYRVTKGHVLVYLVPLSGTSEFGTYGRRMLLKEAVEDELIPPVCHDSEELGSWRLMLIALDHAELDRISEEDGEEARISFAASIGERTSLGKLSLCNSKVSS